MMDLFIAIISATIVRRSLKFGGRGGGLGLGRNPFVGVAGVATAGLKVAYAWLILRLFYACCS